MRLAVALALVATACGARTELPAPDDVEREPCGDAGTSRPCESICGTGVERCVDGYWQDCSAPQPRAPELVGTLRDFRDSHPDFEAPVLGDDHGIVGAELGADDKPVFAGPTPTTTTRDAFDQWFRDVPGVNLPTPLSIPLSPTADPSVFGYSSSEFFPIDGQLYGNESRSHNYHFTFEASARFRYVPGQTFSFFGDDDVFVFVNRRLAVDLGGVHSSEAASIDLDARSAELGISPQGIYSLHFFFAERHTTGSTFQIETTISELDRCDP